MAIDSSKIIHAVREGSRLRESKGIIPLFGVYLSLFSVQYYNRLTFDFEKTIGPHREAEAQDLLIKAAQECGYATFQGIRNSWEWEQIVAPMIDKKEDQMPSIKNRDREKIEDPELQAQRRPAGGFRAAHRP